MTTNGNRKPPCPRIEIASAAASPEEAAAVMAALERFLAETAPVPQTERANAWQRAGLIEGVSPSATSHRRIQGPACPSADAHLGAGSAEFG